MWYIWFQKTPSDTGYPELFDGTVEKKIIKWRKKGGKTTQFDHTVMGLAMLTIPTKHFGWESITKTMKLVSQKCISNFFLSSEGIAEIPRVTEISYRTKTWSKQADMSPTTTTSLEFLLVVGYTNWHKIQASIELL